MAGGPHKGNTIGGSQSGPMPGDSPLINPMEAPGAIPPTKRASEGSSFAGRLGMGTLMVEDCQADQTKCSQDCVGPSH